LSALYRFASLSGWAAGDQRVSLRPFVAGIIGAGRSRTVWMISVLSMPRRYVEVVVTLGFEQRALGCCDGGHRYAAFL
jgi:hypothetical protein